MDFFKDLKSKEIFLISFLSSNFPKQKQNKPNSFSLKIQICGNQDFASLLPTSKSFSHLAGSPGTLEIPSTESTGSRFSLSAPTDTGSQVQKSRSPTQTCFPVLSFQNYTDSCHFWEIALRALLGLCLLSAAERDWEMWRTVIHTKGFAFSNPIKWPLLLRIHGLCHFGKSSSCLCRSDNVEWQGGGTCCLLLRTLCALWSWGFTDRAVCH